MIPTTLNCSNNTTQTVGSATIGIASLILEGRALSDDDYVIPLNGKKHVLLMPPGYNSTTMQQNHVPLINITTNPSAELPLPTNLAVTLKTAAAFEAAVTAVVATNSRPPHQLSALSPLNTKRSSLSSSTSAASSTSSSSIISNNSVSMIPSDSSIQHFQRIKQKLTQLRQSSPRASRDPFLAADHKIVVGGPSSLNHNSAVDSPDLSADNSSSGDDIDNDLSPILSRNTQWKSGGASCTWKSTSNFCNNASTTNVVTGSSSFNSGDFSGNNGNMNGNNCNNKRVSKLSNSGNMNSHLSDNNLLHTLQSLATNCLWTSPRSMGKTTEDWDCNSINANVSGETRADLNSSINNDYFINDVNNGLNFSIMNSSLNSKSNIKNGDINSKKDNKMKAYPQQGPHCDQFLKKIGLNGNKGQSTEFEEHICDMANLNEICFHWQMHCRQLEVMLSRSDSICIEVYLGPENDEILMEQWIIEKTDSPSAPSMTIQALCNAIRSQLYFSQITAWSDSIKKCNPFDKEIMENGRIKSYRFSTCGVASSSLGSGLAAPSSTCSNWPTIKKPRLNIFYRIKPYDSTASFNAKPNIHNFPNVLISGNCAISVCLKSLPRLQGGIPKINETNKVHKTLTPTTKNISGMTSSNRCILVDNNENCDNILKPQSIASSTCKTLAEDSFMFLDDSLKISCTEKGKHKCDYDEEDGGSSDAVGECGDNCSSGASAENGDGETPVNISHREKQLLKYRKRMIKRDKKKKCAINSTSANFEIKMDNCYNLNVRYKNDAKEFKNTELKLPRDPLLLPVESVYEKKIDSRKLLDGKAQINEIHILQQQQELGSINSIGLPLYRTITNTIAESVQTQQIEMISIGTQTSEFFEIPYCDKCNAKMSIICQSCNNSGKNKPLPYLANCQNNDEKEILPEKSLEKGELLLQAIQRVPKTKPQAVRNNNYSLNLSYHNSSPKNTSSTICSPNSCQMYKIEKSPHIHRKQKNCQKKYMNFVNDSNSNLLKIYANKESSQQTFYLQQNFTSTPKTCSQNNCDQSPTCLKAQMNDFEVGNARMSTPSLLLTPPLSVEMNNFSCSDDLCKFEVAQFDTLKIKNAESKNLLNQQKKHKSESEIVKPANLLQISFEVNCEKVKTKANSLMSSTETCTSLPISIVQQHELNKSPNYNKSDISLNNVNTPEVPVQKSNSAPTLPNSPSLSPRFIKQAAIYKRRSRHLSDRSDRSSLGSDDFSDEELDGLYPSPTSSPIKNKFFTKLSAFARRPLLGNLEESLFQKRFTPKMNVAGFKVLLGASGQFCPTQLTIPAASYFYELQGDSLSTPYMCEIRLSRKGYTIPRVGTIQATLLNPFGTVVRMFVIPYDFHDMPPMNQTFIRQRILAVDSDVLTVAESTNFNNNINVNNNNNDNSSSDICKDIKHIVNDNYENGNVNDNIEKNRYNNNNINNNENIVNFNNNANNNIDNNGNNNDEYNVENHQNRDDNVNNVNDNNNINNRYNDNNNNNNNNIINNNNDNYNDNSYSNKGNTNIKNINAIDNVNKNNNINDSDVQHCSKEYLRSLRYSIHLRFQTSRSGRLALHTDIRFLISRRTDCDTAAAHAKGALESPNELRIVTITPDKPRYSARQETQNSNKI